MYNFKKRVNINKGLGKLLIVALIGMMLTCMVVVKPIDSYAASGSPSYVVVFSGVDDSTSPTFIDYITGYNEVPANGELKIPNPSKPGFVFKGWNISVDDRTTHNSKVIMEGVTDLVLDSSELHNVYNGDQFVDCEAVWEAEPIVNNYQVRFEELDAANQADYETTYNLLKSNQSLAIPDPVREGYRFIGWTYSLDANWPNGTLHQGMVIDGQAVENMLGDGLIADYVILRANWQEISEYEITFNSNGGTDVSSQTVRENQLAVEPEAPTREGYTFDGWTDADGNRYDFTTPVNDSIELNAQWIAVSIPVVPDINEGNGGNTQGTTQVNVNNQTTITRNLTPIVADNANIGTTIGENQIPQAAQSSTVDIEDNKTAKGPLTDGSWALINLILAILTVAVFAVTPVIGNRQKRKENDENTQGVKRRLGYYLLGIIVAAIGVLFFIQTEDTSLTMQMTDKWTLVAVVIAAVETVLFAVAIKRKNKVTE